MKVSDIIALVALGVSSYAGYISYKSSAINQGISNFANLHNSINARKAGCLGLASFYDSQDWESEGTGDIPPHTSNDYAEKALGLARALQLCQVREAGSVGELSTCVRNDVDEDKDKQYFVIDVSPSGNLYNNPIC